MFAGTTMPIAHVSLVILMQSTVCHHINATDMCMLLTPTTQLRPLL
jgi:hypothetical protein